MRKCFYALLVMLALFPAVSLAGSSFEDAQWRTLSFAETPQRLSLIHI